jgi:hypothetical protein
LTSTLPKQPFKTVEELDKLRALMLGLPIPRNSKIIPWGYRLSTRTTKEGKEILTPIEICFKYLVEAKKYLDEATYENIAAWISEESGHSITPMTLHNIMRYRMPDDRAAEEYKDRRKLKPDSW